MIEKREEKRVKVANPGPFFKLVFFCLLFLVVVSTISINSSAEDRTKTRGNNEPILDLTIDQPERTAEISREESGFVTFTGNISLDMNGNQSVDHVNYLLQADAGGWKVILNETFFVLNETNNRSTYNVTVEIPAGTSHVISTELTIQGRAIIEPQAEEFLNQEVKGMINVKQYYDLESSIYNGNQTSSKPGESIYFDFLIVNKGNDQDTVKIELYPETEQMADLFNLTVIFSQTEYIIDEGMSQICYVEIQVPENDSQTSVSLYSLDILAYSYQARSLGIGEVNTTIDFAFIVSPNSSEEDNIHVYITFNHDLNQENSVVKHVTPHSYKTRHIEYEGWVVSSRDGYDKNILVNLSAYSSQVSCTVSPEELTIQPGFVGMKFILNVTIPPRLPATDGEEVQPLTVSVSGGWKFENDTDMNGVHPSTIMINIRPYESTPINNSIPKNYPFPFNERGKGLVYNPFFILMLLAITLVIVSTLIYSRLKRKSLLDHAVRKKIYDCIRDNPGIHYRELQRSVELPSGMLAHHLNMLEDNDFIKSKQDSRYRRFYLFDEKPGIKFQLSEIQEKIMDSIRNSPGITISDISTQVGSSRMVVNYHTKILDDAGLIYLEKEGRSNCCYPAAHKV